MTALAGVLVLVVALLTLLVAGLLRSHAEILRRLHALEGGGASSPVDFRVHPDRQPPDPGVPTSPSTDLSGLDVNQDAIAIAVAGVEHRTLLAFLSSACTTCAGFWNALGEADLGLPGDVRVVVVTQGPAHEEPRSVATLAAPTLPVVMSDEAWLDYEVPGSPYFVLVDGPTRRAIGSGTGVSWEQVRGLLSEALPGSEQRGSSASVARA